MKSFQVRCYACMPARVGILPSAQFSRRIAVALLRRASWSCGHQQCPLGVNCLAPLLVAGPGSGLRRGGDRRNAQIVSDDSTKISFVSDDSSEDR
jgi:hypothetical protein